MQGINTVTEGKQGPVDVCALYHSDSSVVSLRGSFRASQINEGEFTNSELCLNARVLIFVLANYLKNCV